MSKEDIEKIIADTQKLKERQRSVDKPKDLEKIPLLKIEDITKQCDKLIIAEDEIADTKVLRHDIDTNGICYLRMLFDISNIAYEDINYLSYWKNSLVELLQKITHMKHWLML